MQVLAFDVPPPPDKRDRNKIIRQKKIPSSALSIPLPPFRRNLWDIQFLLQSSTKGLFLSPSWSVPFPLPVLLSSQEEKDLTFAPVVK